MIIYLQRSACTSDGEICNGGMSLMDMGKYLLKYARESDLKGVKKALTYGAPFTCDWVRKYILFYTAFIDLEIAYYRIPKKAIREFLCNKVMTEDC